MKVSKILDTICHDPSFGFALLGCWIPPLEPRGEHLLRGHACLMKGYAPVWPDSVLAQLRAGTAGAVQGDEHLAALRCDLDAESGKARVPVDRI
jgi:hypothetical protein